MDHRCAPTTSCRHADADSALPLAGIAVWENSIEAARAGEAHSEILCDHPADQLDQIAAAETRGKGRGRGSGDHHAFGATHLFRAVTNRKFGLLRQ